MPEGNGDKIRQKVLGLVSKLPPPEVRRILAEIDDDHDRPTEGATIAKASLVEHLNQMRPYRVRRLFTNLFDPFLTTDDSLLRTDQTTYGLIQRVDIGGLWAGVSRLAFPELVREIQMQIDDLARSTLLEEVLVSPPALAAQERMRVATLHFLGTLGHDKAVTGRFLKLVNGQRLRDLGSRMLYVEKIYDLDEDYLRMVAEILTHQPEFSREIQDILALIPEAAVGTEGGADENANGDGERLVDRILQSTDVLLYRFQDRKLRSHYWLMLPLSVLHVKRRYDIASLFIRYDRNERSGEGPMAQALRVHFDGCCRTIREVLSGSLRLSERLKLSLIKITTSERTRLDQEMARLRIVLDSLAVSGLFESMTTAYTFRRPLQELDGYFTTRIAWAALERIQDALASRLRPTPDFEDVLWLCRFLSAWQAVARQHRLAENEIRRWRGVIGDEGKAALKKALEIEEGELLAERMAHLVRLQRLLGLFGVRVMKQVPISSQNATRIVLERIRDTDHPAPEEVEMIGDYIALARAEKQKLRNWSSIDMAELLRLADAAGY